MIQFRLLISYRPRTGLIYGRCVWSQPAPTSGSAQFQLAALTAQPLDWTSPRDARPFFAALGWHA